VAVSDLLGDDYPIYFADGHTPGLMMVELPSAHGPLLYASDLIPGAPWMHLPITMGYDRYPERLIEEKQTLLQDLEARGGGVFFVHDPTVAWARAGRDERGRFFAADPHATLTE
jgi:glyoxylase-like metal-dependent hydrolase (beta-lactamase superfamily II)